MAKGIKLACRKLVSSWARRDSNLCLHLKDSVISDHQCLADLQAFLHFVVYEESGQEKHPSFSLPLAYLRLNFLKPEDEIS